MIDNNSLEWNKQNFRSLRLRLGWSRSDMARRLKCDLTEVEAWEEGNSSIEINVSKELEIILRQAEACSDEVKYTPMAEKECDKKALEQIEFSRVKAELE